MLIMIPLTGVLGLNTLPDKTVLCYIHKIQSRIQYGEMLGLCKCQYKTALCYTHYIMHSFPSAISFSVLERIKEKISVELLALHYDYTEKTVH
jgi:hypothetical protein